jgi:hypothetical protein
MSELHYISKTKFFALLGLSFLTGQRMFARGVLEPAAMLDGETPLFIHSGEAIAEAHRAIASYRARLKLSRFNINKPN